LKSQQFAIVHSFENAIITLDVVEDIAHLSFQNEQVAVWHNSQMMHISKVRELRLLIVKIVFVKECICKDFGMSADSHFEFGSITIELKDERSMCACQQIAP